MTREVVGLEPAPGPLTPRPVEFDLGELPRQGSSAPTPPQVPARLRLRRWQPWTAPVLALLVGLLTAFAGWHVGADRRQSALDRLAVAHPAVFAWVVDGGPTLASAPDDPRVAVNLHVANLSPDPVRIRSVSISTDEGNATVQLDGYSPVPIAPDDNTIAPLVARPSCSSRYEGAFLSVVLVRTAADGSRRTLTVPAGADGRIGDLLSSILDRVCSYPTRDDPASGVDGLVIDQSAGAAGATVTITNHSKGLRQVRVTSDESPAFALVSSLIGDRVLRPEEALAITLRVRVLDCSAVVSLREWAASVALDVVRRGDSLEASATGDVQTGFGLPDLMLVPGGAAIQRACGS
ncbi:MAG: hypothetical protein ACJ71T_01965 [Actinomycetales bacterium]